MSQDPWRLGIRDLSDLFRSGRSRPSDVLEAVLSRMEALEPTLNAFALVDREGARTAARMSDRRWHEGMPIGPLDGVPVSVKDNIPVAGLRCAWGSRLFLDHVPERDELPVARLRAAGAVILGKTNVSEFTVGPAGTVSTEAFGTTRNPWDVSVTTGSSSGGAVAAVASGMGAAALATDGGGSIRRPAGYCNLVGLKPSAGRVARWDGLPVILPDCEVVGPIARTVADLHAVLKAIAGPDPRDRLSLAFSQNPLSENLPQIGPQRILYVPRFGESPVDAPISESCALAARALQALGHHVEEGAVPFDPGLFARNWPLFTECGLAAALRGMDWEDKIGPDHVAMMRRGFSHSASDYVAVLEEFRRLQVEIGIFFQSFDILMTPTSGAMPWPAERYAPPHHRVFTGFANAAGVPAMTVPGPPSREGLPIGFQLVAPFGADEKLLALAASFEAAHPWEDRWPDI